MNTVFELLRQMVFGAVLHSFALSLLVPDRQYETVARWINDHHLGARIIYFRVPARSAPATPPDRQSVYPLLIDMLEVKPGSGFETWLEGELARKANHACVEDIADFRKTQKALTRTGQIKDRDRHEKDDRKRIGDRREYVLGWTNEARIDALVRDAATLSKQLSKTADVIGRLVARDRGAEKQLQSLASLDEHATWTDLDWMSLVGKIGGGALLRVAQPLGVGRARRQDFRHINAGRRPAQGQCRSRPADQPGHPTPGNARAAHRPGHGRVPLQVPTSLASSRSSRTTSTRTPSATSLASRPSSTSKRSSSGTVPRPSTSR